MRFTHRRRFTGCLAADPETLVRHLSATLEGYRRSISGMEDDLEAQAEIVTLLLLHGLAGPTPRPD